MKYRNVHISSAAALVLVLHRGDGVSLPSWLLYGRYR